MRKRVAREWLWAAILVIVAGFALLLSGCATNERVARARPARAPVNNGYKYRAVYLGYPSIYLIEFEGHDYLTRGSNSYILHTVSCKGIHGE